MPEFEAVKDSGQRESFSSGAIRDKRGGKGRYDLLPPRAIRRIAKHFENGALKYGDRNWEKGMPNSKYMESAMRHLFNALEGMTDEDHLAAACWNILAIIDQEERMEQCVLDKQFDDLPKTPPLIKPPTATIDIYPYTKDVLNGPDPVITDFLQQEMNKTRQIDPINRSLYEYDKITY